MKNSGKNSFMKERKMNLLHTLLFYTIYLKKDGHWRAEYLRRHKVFYHFGENCYYHPRKIPSDACMISIGNNVCIAADVKFIAHDVFSIMFNKCERYNTGTYSVHFDPIIIKDNVCIGANVLIMPGAIIGNNVIIAGGGVITKNVPDNVIVGGNPAKIIGKTDDLAKKRMNICEMKWNATRNDLETYYWRNLLKGDVY